MIEFIVVGVVALLTAAIMAVSENFLAAAVIGCLGIGMLIMAPLSHHAEQRQARELAHACREAPAVAAERLHHRYTGRRVEPPGPLGAIGIDKPAYDAVFVQTTAATTDPEGRERLLAIRTFRTDLPPPGAPVDFCGYPAGDVYWWPREGHQKGRGALYGQPDGPYPAVRWVRDMEPAHRAGSRP